MWSGTAGVQPQEPVGGSERPEHADLRGGDDVLRGGPAEQADRRHSGTQGACKKPRRERSSDPAPYSWLVNETINFPTSWPADSALRRVAVLLIVDRVDVERHRKKQNQFFRPRQRYREKWMRQSAARHCSARVSLTRLHLAARAARGG